MQPHPIAMPPDHMTDHEYDRLRARLAAAMGYEIGPDGEAVKITTTDKTAPR